MRDFSNINIYSKDTEDYHAKSDLNVVYRVMG